LSSLFVDKKTCNKFIKRLLNENIDKVEKLENTILYEEKINELITVYSSYMMEPFFSQIEKEREKFI
jgi:hypothetical protein